MHFHPVIKAFFLLFIAVALSGLIWLLIRKRLSFRRQIICSLSGGLMLTGFSWFFLIGHSLFFKSEGMISGEFADWRETAAHQYVCVEKLIGPDTTFFDRSFIFIDVARTISLRSAGDADPKDSLFTVTTNRRQLAMLFNELSADSSHVQLVACDVIFDHPCLGDQQLLAALLKLEKQKRLVLAHYRGLERSNPGIYGHLNAEDFGTVTKAADEPVYYSHSITGSQPGSLSFPYKMYSKACNASLEKDAAKGHVFTNFVTELNFRSARQIFRPLVADSAKLSKETVLTDSVPNAFELGQATSDIGRFQLTSRLKQVSSPQIIFIGNMTNAQSDTHMTAAGRLLGSTILLNEFYYLARHYHIMPLWKCMLFLFALFIGYTGLLFILLSRADRQDSRSARFHQHKNRNERFSSVFEWTESVLAFVLDEAYYLYLVLFLFLIDLSFHKVINIFGIIYIVPFSYALLKYFLKIRNKRRHQSRSRNTNSPP